MTSENTKNKLKDLRKKWLNYQCIHITVIHDENPTLLTVLSCMEKRQSSLEIYPMYIDYVLRMDDMYMVKDLAMDKIGHKMKIIKVIKRPEA